MKRTACILTTIFAGSLALAGCQKDAPTTSPDDVTGDATEEPVEETAEEPEEGGGW